MAQDIYFERVVWRMHAVRLKRRSPRNLNTEERSGRDIKKRKVIILLWDKVKEEGRMFLLITNKEPQSMRAIVPGRSIIEDGCTSKIFCDESMLSEDDRGKRERSNHIRGTNSTFSVPDASSERRNVLRRTFDSSIF